MSKYLKRDNTQSDYQSNKYKWTTIHDKGPDKKVAVCYRVDRDGNVIKQEKLLFNGIYDPEEISKDAKGEMISRKRIDATVKVTKFYIAVIRWRYSDDDDHEYAMRKIKRYKMMYHYEMRINAIKCIEESNKTLSVKSWYLDHVKMMTEQKIDEDPWYLVEWEDKLKDLGVIKESRSNFTLAHCDIIGAKLGLTPMNGSRLVQYCVETLNELCYKQGSTMFYFDPFIKEAVSKINFTEMNTRARSKINAETLRGMVLHRDDYFFIGRTDMHNARLFVSLRKMWDAQNYIVEKLYSLVSPMNTPFYTERELLVNLAACKYPVTMMGYDVLRNKVSPKIWYNRDVDEIVEDFQIFHEIPSIDDIQRKAIHTSFNERVSIVSGGPGRGKSSCVLKAILYTLDRMVQIPPIDPSTLDYVFADEVKALSKAQQHDYLSGYTFVHVVSFTGKAVSRIKELLIPSQTYFHFQPMTIHRLLSRCKKSPFITRAKAVIIVDEVSMVSDMLFYQLLRCFKNIQRVILLGDYDQLPPIQPGDLLKELIESRCLPVTRLIVNYRQGEGSELPNLADKIIGRENKGAKITRLYGGWDHLLNVSVPKQKQSIEDVFNQLITDCEVHKYSSNICRTQIYNDIRVKVEKLRESGVKLFKDCVVLVAKRVEVAELNNILQPAFLGRDINEENGMYHTYEGERYKYVIGDRVMYLENNYEQDMFNGDIGKVFGLIEHQSKIGKNFVSFILETYLKLFKRFDIGL